MPNCDLDDCSLKDYIDELRTDQKKLSGKHDAILEKHVEVVKTQALLVQKVDTWMANVKEDKEDNEKDHDILFARGRGNVKWAHLAMAITGVSGFIGIIYMVGG
jgi:hypothetical protein